MYPKVRCTGCNKVIGEIWDDFQADYQKITDYNYTEIWKKYDIKRMCCKNSLVSTVESWKLYETC